MGMRSIEPLKLKKAELNLGGEKDPFFMRLGLHNLDLLGAAKYEVVDFDLEIDNYFNVSVKVPYVRGIGKCSARGKLLILQFDSVGDFFGELGMCLQIN